MAGVGNSTNSRDPKEIDPPPPKELGHPPPKELDHPPPPKKTKIETDSEDEAEIEARPRGSFLYKGKLLLPALSCRDLECDTQRDLFYKQLADSEGFDVEWDRFNYVFNVVNFDWNPFIDDKRSNAEMMDMLIQAAVEEHDEENGTKLESVEYVSANIVSVKGFLFFITFRATDVLSSDQEPKLYQAKVSQYCRQEVNVLMVRRKPPQ
uniref:Cystatin domain-containing protein n=1 Tax=Noccaea caerulescens TaxID=107243 RepID=A0A1J3J7Q8_NOCCA